MLKQIKSILIDLVFVILKLVTFFVLHKLGYYLYTNGDIGYTFYCSVNVFLVYLSLVVITSVLSSIRIIGYVQAILYLPLFIFSLFFKPFILSFIGMLTGAVLLHYLISVIGKIGLPLVGIRLEEPTLHYFAFTSTIIIFSLYGNSITYFVTKYVLFRKAEDIERYNGIFNQNKFSYIIYVIAFISLVCFTYFEFNKVVLHESMLTFKKVLIPSFATFVAWDRLIAKSHLFKFEGVKDLLRNEIKERLNYTAQEDNQEQQNIKP